MGIKETLGNLFGGGKKERPKVSPQARAGMDIYQQALNNYRNQIIEQRANYLVVTRAIDSRFDLTTVQKNQLKEELRRYVRF